MVVDVKCNVKGRGETDKNKQLLKDSLNPSPLDPLMSLGLWLRSDPLLAFSENYFRFDIKFKI